VPHAGLTCRGRSWRRLHPGAGSQVRAQELGGIPEQALELWTAMTCVAARLCRRGVARSRFADPQHDLSEHVPFRQALVCLSCIDQRKCFRDRDLELGGVDRDIEFLELADSGSTVIGNELDAPSFLRLGLDLLWTGKPATRSQVLQGSARARRRPPMPELNRRRQARNGEPPWRHHGAARRPPHRRPFRARAPSRLAGRGCENTGPAQPGELDS
jgi:hypothetical protein